MVNIKFVGFQEQVETPDTYELVDFKEEILCKLDRKQIFSLLCEPEQLSKWFFEVFSIDSRPGGKFKFLAASGDEAEAICTSFTLGEEIVLLSNLFGEFSAKILTAHDEVKLQIHFKLLTDDSTGMTETFKTFTRRLKEISSK